jgi:hypothetical protein
MQMQLRMPRLRYLIALLILLSFIPDIISAQKLFRDGYIIKKDNTDLEGLIGFSPGQDIPKSCVFKRFEIAVEIKYFPGDLKAFGYRNGTRFEIFDIEGKPSFYETLIKGELSLYRRGSKYYIRKNDGTPVELKNNRMILNEESNSKEFTNIQGILQYLTSGKGINIPINLSLKNDLLPLLEEYNRASGSNYAVFKDTYSEKDLVANVRRAGINKNTYGIMGGANEYSLHIGKKSGMVFSGTVNQISPVYGVFYERVISGRTDKLAIHAELLFGQHSLYSYTEINHPNLGIERNDSFIDISPLKIPVMLQYSFRGRRVVPYFNAGIAYATFLNKRYFHISEFEYNNNSIYTTEDSNINLKSSEITPVLSAGIYMRLVKLIRIRVEGRVEYGKGLIQNSSLAITTLSQNSIQGSLLFGISF